MWTTTALVSEGAPKGKGEATGQPRTGAAAGPREGSRVWVSPGFASFGV